MSMVQPLHGNQRPSQTEIYRTYLIVIKKNAERSQHGNDWTGEHWDSDRLWPKTSWDSRQFGSWLSFYSICAGSTFTCLSTLCNKLICIDNVYILHYFIVLGRAQWLGRFLDIIGWDPSVCNSNQWSGRFFGIIGWDPSVCKFNRLYVDIFRFFYINLRYIS